MFPLFSKVFLHFNFKTHEGLYKEGQGSATGTVQTMAQSKRTCEQPAGVN